MREWGPAWRGRAFPRRVLLLQDGDPAGTTPAPMPIHALSGCRTIRRVGRVAEGAPLLREYGVNSSIEGSNPSLSAISPNDRRRFGLFLMSASGDSNPRFKMEVRPRSARARSRGDRREPIPHSPLSSTGPCPKPAWAFAFWTSGSGVRLLAYESITYSSRLEKFRLEEYQ